MDIKLLIVGPIETNCYLLCDEKEKVCAVIDPGDEAPRILSAVERTGCTMTAILLTHGHYDHTSAVADLVRQCPGTAVYLSAKDTAAYGAPQSLFPPVPGAKDYGEGDTVKVGSLTVQVLATPGHSEGGVSLLCGDALFCGDTLFAGDCGRTDLYGGSMPVLLKSLRRLGQLPGNPLVLPGHMETSYLDQERTGNPWMRQALMMGA